MKQSLDLRFGQHLTITPQLQQAIRLLQLSSVELQQEIREALESNPLLEEKDGEPEAGGEAGSGPDEETGTAETAEAAPEPAELEMEQSSYDDASGDGDPTESFDPPTTSAARHDDGAFDVDARNSPPQTLREHLLWQMHMTPFSDTDRRIAEAIIDALNEDGYLTVSLEDIRQVLGKELAVEVDEIQAVLHQLQNFEPLGVGARDLAECLRLQLKTHAAQTPYLREAVALATAENLALLAARDYTTLRRTLRLSPEALTQVVRLIQSLNPRPGATVQSSQAGYVVPDVVVRKTRGVWRADLNSEVSPRLRINRQYERMIQRGNASPSNRYLQDQLQQARWLIKSLNSRNETLLKVARTIVDRQRAFFDHGPQAMKPLVLHDIAEVVGMHESTISRVTTSKYMLTPRGVFELKYFFSSHVTTTDGGACSAVAIREIIRKVVGGEPSDRPVSDSKIADILAQQGIPVARRTVAKYREIMNIPPSNQRKSIV